MLLQEDIDYFNRGEAENSKFWNRLGGMPLLKGLTVLDVGCGHGSLCINAALTGARKVVGLDTDSHRIDFANENLRQNYPQLTHIVEFKDIDLRHYDGLSFDVILSKDSFEHILDLDIVMAEMTKRLKSGGRIYIGFAPLYSSPWGDHHRTQIPIPWGHLIVSEQFIIQRLNRQRKQKISSIYDLGLNKMTLADYRSLFSNSGLYIVYLQTNVSKNIVMKLFSLFSRIKFLEEYFTHNLYSILEKP
ncbi:MAG: class I SAM-dependent methyltransferase [Mojavia pulchra JT2-VF2]|uniref:Class I SAM-dependent methyltransferase n=1 Tax=Mojavia pulchra JT2-VF2 TaxID=287848 RepID=A0A951PVD8_9NOST|nr:class I SAM-dependent methyltransferase [Mojavia pulchra JT2-VF2]